MDAVRLSADEFRATYERSFRLWSGLYLDATANPSIRGFCLAADAFPRQPALPRQLRLKRPKHAKLSRLYATGHTCWGASPENEDDVLPPFRREFVIDVALGKPASVSIAAASDRDFASWFARPDRNLVGVLTLAWTYVLSARWIDLMPGDRTMEYTSSLAGSREGDEGDNFEVDIGNAGPDEARWWAAILAPDQGWKATISWEGETYESPWSTCLQSGFRIIGTHPQASYTPPSFSESARFLRDFCSRNNAVDQGWAALSAVLLFPSMASGRTLQLPNPGRPSQETLSGSSECQSDWIQDDCIDRLMALGCYGRMHSMLLSVFYEPAIPCNASTPWIQGALAAIETLAAGRPLVLGRMFMSREPRVALLWMGAVVLGLEEAILRGVRGGLIPLDINSAAWSGTIQSFIQQPLSDPVVDNGLVARADECHLLFLAQSTHSRIPLCQWKPFGSTPLADTDIDVRLYAAHGGLGLRYRGTVWDCENPVHIAPPSGSDGTGTRQAPAGTLSGGSEVPVSYRHLDQDKEDASENATRNIFSWLRGEGCCLHEKEMWEHEWFCLSDEEDSDQSEGEDSDPDDSSKRKPSDIDAWLRQLVDSENTEEKDPGPS